MKTRAEELNELISIKTDELSQWLNILNLDYKQYDRIMKLHDEIVKYNVELNNCN